MAMAYQRVCTARSGLPAPIFCAPSADAVDSMDEGTRNRKPITFSTMPTAAASVRPRWLTMTVMKIKAIWIRPSCRAMGTPMDSSFFITGFWGRKSSFCRGRPFFCLFIMPKDTPTLTACERVVPSAAPAGPSRSKPMNKMSSPILTAQATAMKIMGLLESPMPRKTELMTL